MKKLLVITVIFALVAGAAFAETSVGGSVETRWMIAENSGADGAKTLTSGGIDNMGLGLSATNDDGTYGGMGKVVFNGHGASSYHSWEESPMDTKWDRAFVWWQPIEQVKFFLGKDGDGLFNTANLIRWGHFQMDRGVTTAEGWEAGDYLLGNWDAYGFAVMIYPVEGLEINLALPIPQQSKQLYEDDQNVLTGIQLQAGYNVDSVGKFIVTYQGEAAGDRIGLTYQGAQFIEGLSFEIGLSYELGSKFGTKYGKTKIDTDADGTPDLEIVYDKKDPIKVAFGVHYASGDFGVKTRFFLAPDKGKWVFDLAGVEIKNDGFFYFKTDIMPYYNLSFGTIYLNIRVETMNKDDILWEVNPYLRMGMGGAGDWRVGLRFGSNTGKDADTWVKIATSWVLNF